MMKVKTDRSLLVSAKRFGWFPVYKLDTTMGPQIALSLDSVQAVIDTLKHVEIHFSDVISSTDDSVAKARLESWCLAYHKYAGLAERRYEEKLRDVEYSCEIEIYVGLDYFQLVETILLSLESPVVVSGGASNEGA